MQIENLLHNVLTQAEIACKRLPKKTRQRKHKIKDCSDEILFNAPPIELLPFVSQKTYNWFINYITRRRDKKLMSHVQNNLHFVFEKDTYKLMLCYNKLSGEVFSAFEV